MQQVLKGKVKVQQIIALILRVVTIMSRFPRTRPISKPLPILLPKVKPIFHKPTLFDPKYRVFSWTKSSKLRLQRANTIFNRD